MEQRAVPVVRRVDGRFHQAAGGALAQPSFFFVFFLSPLPVRRCTTCETPLSNAATKWRPNVSACPHINQLRGSSAYFLSRSGGFRAPIGCHQQSVKRMGRTAHFFFFTFGTCCSLTFGHNGNARGVGIAISALKGSTRRSSRQR